MRLVQRLISARGVSEGGITITVDHTKVASNLTDFVMTVNPTDLGATTLAEAQSIRVYKDDGVTELPRDVITLNKMKIKADLSSSTDTVLKVVMDKVSADYGVTTTYGRNNVYTGFKAVYDFASGNSNDRTGNGYNGTDTSVSYSSDYASFNGSSSKIALGTSDIIPTTSGTSFSVLIKFNASVNQTTDVQISNLKEGFTALYGSPDADYRGVFLYSDGGYYKTTKFTFSTSTDYVRGLVYDGSYINSYIDGVFNSSNNIGSKTRTALGGNYIGCRYSGSSSFFGGKIFSVDIMQGALSADYISTQYNNTNAPSTFYAVTL